MKRINKKGYFLAETIVVIALVTTIVAYVFPNVLSIYNNYKNTSLYYDQTKDIYTLEAVYEYMLDNSPPGAYTFLYDDGSTHTLNYLEQATFDNRDGDYFLDTDNNFKSNTSKNPRHSTNTGVGCANLLSLTPINCTITGSDLQALYIISYMNDANSDKYNFNLYLKRLKKNTTDNSSYRLIGVFKDGNSERYASIKIENPNPKRNCNL